MRIFFTGAFDCYRDFKYEVMLRSFGVEDRLISYAFLQPNQNRFFDRCKRTYDKLLKTNLYNDMMLDSGAFTTAFKDDYNITLTDYIQFCLGPTPKYVIGLDVIPIDKGHGFTRKYLDNAAKETLKNCRTLRSLGIECVPTFHQGESYEFLKLYCDEFPIVCLSISSKRKMPLEAQYAHLDRCFNIIPDTTKVHGLAITDFRLPLRYPFYSVDSSTWEREARYGKIKIRMFGQYATIGLTKGLLYSVSKHYDLVSNEVRKECDRYLEKLNTNVDRCRDYIYERYRVNIVYYNRMLRDLKPDSYQYKELF